MKSTRVEVAAKKTRRETSNKQKYMISKISTTRKAVKKRSN